MYVAMPTRPHLSHPISPQLKAALQSGHFQLSPSEVEQLAEQVGWLFCSFCWAPGLLCWHLALPWFCCTLCVSAHTLTSTCPVRTAYQPTYFPCHTLVPQLDSQHSGTIDWSEWVAAMADWRPVRGLPLQCGVCAPIAATPL